MAIPKAVHTAAYFNNTAVKFISAMHQRIMETIYAFVMLHYDIMNISGRSLPQRKMYKASPMLGSILVVH